MPKWTEQQQQAIDARNRTILVSAAAGSGKTAVLIERIVQLIREGWPIDRMLIVTFTKAAAAEMRQRLSSRLTREAAEDPETMGKALDDLESTEISTIHSFCQKVLKNNFQAVGIDPMVRACDDQQKKALYDEAWLEAFNALLEEESDADFLTLADAWDQKRLYEMTLSLHDFLMSLPFPFDWLRRKIDFIQSAPILEHPWFKTILMQTSLEIEGIGELLMRMRDMLDEPGAVQIRRETWEADADLYHELLAVDWGDPIAAREAVVNYKAPRAKPARNLTPDEEEWIARYKKQRDGITAIIKRAKVRLDVDPDKTAEELENVRRQLEGLAALTERTNELFLKKKEEQHVIDFSDMEQFTMQILSKADMRRQMQDEYDHIFVDECQDVSQIQDAILQAIHNENNFMFMVGDVKQSIYRFRKADPTLFLRRLRTFSDDPQADERRIILQKNFRSRSNVLEATNRVFRAVMRPRVTELTYMPEDELICGRETTDDPPVEMHVINIDPGESGETPEALELEARVAAGRIRALLGEQFDDGKGMRPYTYRDMVILLSAASNTAPRLVELLGEHGIPCFYDGSAAFYALPEVQAMKALLTVLDNPLQDVPLMAVLKMQPFGLTDGELADVRLCRTGRDVPFHEAFDACCEGEGILSGKCRGIRERLEQWRFEADSSRLSDFVWHVMRDSGFYAACGAKPEGELRQANLRLLYQRAIDYETNMGQTLSGFLAVMDQQQQGDDRMSAKILGENEDLVRIMTMHKSKGLEFPVVFCMQMSGRLHKAYRGDLMMNTELGLALPYVDGKRRIKRPTVANDAFAIQRMLDDKAERARLLYVAMTRARERLIMIGCCKDDRMDMWQMASGDYRVWLASSMTDWIMQGIDIHTISTGDPQPGNPWKCSFTAMGAEGAVDKVTERRSIAGWLEEQLAIPPEGVDATWDAPEERPLTQPLKTSVTSLVRKQVLHDPMPLTQTEEEMDDKRRGEEIVAPLRLSEVSERPAFMEEKRVTGAERGTLMHRVISLIPLEALRAAESLPVAIRQSVHDLVAREVITAQELMQLNLRGLTDFFAGGLGRRLLASPHVRREWAFNLMLSEDADRMLQGVIDCVFEEEGGWVLLDYKTDRIADETAFCQRYAMQLEWYARALERITGKAVKEMWLWSITLGKGYRIDRQDA